MACAILLSSLCARAQDGGRTYVSVSVNDVDRGEALALVQGDAVAIDRRDLERLGIPVARAAEREAFGIRFVDLGTLAPAIRYRFDREDLTVHLVLDARLLPSSTMSLAPQRPNDLTHTYVPSASLNYAISTTGSTPVAASFEERVSWHDSQALTNTIGRTVLGRFARGYSTYTIDSLDRLRRVSIGDVAASYDDISAGATLGGIEVRRAFSLDPYSITFPLPSLTTSLLTPSVAQVYVNGTLVQTIDLPPGNYTLANIPVRSGLTNAQVVVVDAFGRAQSQSSEFYGANSLLRKGLTDYAYDAGVLRTDIAGPNDRYGSPAVSGRYRIGLTDRFTAGARAEAGAGVLDGGAAFDVLAGERGLIHTAIDASDARGVRGIAGALGYSTQGLRSSFGVLVVGQSGTYASLGLPISQDRALLNAQATYSARLSPHLNVTLLAAATNDRDYGSTRRSAIVASRSLGPVSVNASLSRNWSASGASTGFDLSLTRSFGHDAMSLQSTASSGPSATTLTLSHASGEALGTNDAVSIDAGSLRPANAFVDLGLPYARAGAALLRRGDGGYALSGSVAGAVTLADGDVLYSQPLSDAFVILKSPGVSNVPAYLSSQYVGRTDARGDVLVPFAIANQANRVSLSDTALPLDVSFGGSSFDVAPGYHSGAIAVAQVTRIHSIAGFYTVVVRGARRVPAFGSINLRSGSLERDGRFDGDGRFYIGDIAAGTYAATLTDQGGTCATTIVVPAFDGPRYNLGRLTCVASQ